MEERTQSLAVGTGIFNLLGPKNCFRIGRTDDPTRDNSIFICINPNKFRYPDSNINIGNFMEGNSDTNKMLFYGPVEADGGFVVPETLHLAQIEKCDVCDFDLQKKLEEFNREQQANQELLEELQQFTGEPIKDAATPEKPVGIPGVTWGGKTSVCSLCFDCMRDAALEYKARQSWLDKHGDPVQKLQKQVEDLTRTVTALQSKIQHMEETRDAVLRASYGSDYLGNSY